MTNGVHLLRIYAIHNQPKYRPSGYAKKTVARTKPVEKIPVGLDNEKTLNILIQTY